jgi:hypothetical protein
MNDPVLIRRILAGLIAALLWLSVDDAPAQTILTEGTNISADASATNGRIAFDLLGSIWIMPARGGQAQELPNTIMPARSPKWSPSAEFLLYQAASRTGNQLWLHDMASGESRLLSNSRSSDQQASWHPRGERVIFSSAVTGSGLDLWELDIPTGLRWRVSDNDGDETEPVWSANGEHLAYVLHDDNGWSLMLREHGQPDRQLLQSARSIHAPSWRPDGSLITYLSETEDGYSLDMAILSDPPMVRHLSTAEDDFFLAPVSWLDRQRMIYAADGHILSRDFDARRALPVHFRALIDNTGKQHEQLTLDPQLPLVTPPAEKLVIRAARLFDGVHDDYRNDIDVLVDGPIITAVGARQEWPDATILDLGNVTVLPGFVDIYSAMPKGHRAGASLLAYGVTTVISDDPVGTLLPDLWHGEETPGPRLISVGNISFEDIHTVADRLPSSPLGRQYQDMQVAVSNGPEILMSGLANAGTPGLNQLLRSRQAQYFGHNAATVRHYSAMPRLGSAQSSIVVGSKPNGLPPGLALHAELRALAAAGLSGDQVLRAAGANISKSLGLGQQIGAIAPGALADLVLVAGDPLTNIADTLKIVAVVRNGRFYSLISLLEPATPVAASP